MNARTRTLGVLALAALGVVGCDADANLNRLSSDYYSCPRPGPSWDGTESYLVEFGSLGGGFETECLSGWTDTKSAIVKWSGEPGCWQFSVFGENDRNNDTSIAVYEQSGDLDCRELVCDVGSGSVMADQAYFEPGNDYVVVVDKANPDDATADGLVLLASSCGGFEDCSNGMDDNANGRIDCDDVACAASSECVTDENCSNRRDDDGDGEADCRDSDCDGASVCSIREVCFNGIDDSFDGYTDCADADCDDEPMCQGLVEDCTNGVDDSFDGYTDCNDADCDGYPGCENGTPELCFNGQDDENDSLIDCEDPDCFDQCEGGSSEICSDGQDNDGDGRADCDDSDCSNSPFCTGEPGAWTCQNVIANGVSFAGAAVGLSVPDSALVDPIGDPLSLENPCSGTDFLAAVSLQLEPDGGATTCLDIYAPGFYFTSAFYVDGDELFCSMSQPPQQCDFMDGTRTLVFSNPGDLPTPYALVLIHTDSANEVDVSAYPCDAAP